MTMDVNLNIFTRNTTFHGHRNRLDSYRYRTAGEISKTKKSFCFSGITFCVDQLSLQLPERDPQNTGGFASVATGGMQNLHHMGSIIFLECAEAAA